MSQANEETKRRFDEVISLGGHCQPAFQIRRLLPDQKVTYPFDWMITPRYALINLLRNGCKNFLNAESLRQVGSVGTHAHILDQATGVTLIHDFETYNLLRQVPLVKKKYIVRFERLSAACMSNESILFIWQDETYAETSAGDGKSQSEESINFVLRSSYPKLDFCVLSVTCGDPGLRSQSRSLVCWDMPRSLEWSGDNENWDAAFNAFSLVPTDRQL